MALKTGSSPLSHKDSPQGFLPFGPSEVGATHLDSSATVMVASPQRSSVVPTPGGSQPEPESTSGDEADQGCVVQNAHRARRDENQPAAPPPLNLQAGRI